MATRSFSSLEEFGNHHVTKGLGRITSGVMANGKGSILEFQDGRKMLDFTTGIGVTSLGHCHPKVSQAAADQCLQLTHGQCSIAFHEPYLRLIEKLLPHMPHPSLDSFFFWNSGTEAVEAAIKMSRMFTGKENIICMQGSYHGRTYGSMAVTTSKTIYFKGAGGLMPSVQCTSFPYWHQNLREPSTPESELTAASLADLELLLAQRSAPSDTAAILVETIVGEGGYVPAPPEFLKGLREICDKNGILLIIDEVQCGFGRSGDFWAVSESGVKPDLLITAKGLANGFPLSGVITRKELSDTLAPGSLGGTYAGNPVSCAAAGAVVSAIESENILSNVKARSEQLFGALNTLASESNIKEHILDVRGRGLMVAVEFASPTSPLGVHDPNTNKNTPKGMAAKVTKKCVEKGMLILTTSVFEVVRFIPALNVSEEEMKRGCDIFAEAVRDVVREG